MFNLKLFELTSNPDHSIESAIISLLIVIVSFSLYIFWTRRNALLNFRAWALLLALINTIFFLHYLPMGPHILSANGQEFCFTDFGKVFLRFLQFLTSLITIMKLYFISERYLPKHVLYNGKSESKTSMSGFGVDKMKIFARSLAIYHTLRYGGNHVKDDDIIKKSIEKRLKKGKV
jgi:hypothetical protein